MINVLKPTVSDGDDTLRRRKNNNFHKRTKVIDMHMTLGMIAFCIRNADKCAYDSALSLNICTVGTQVFSLGEEIGSKPPRILVRIC